MGHVPIDERGVDAPQRRLPVAFEPTIKMSEPVATLAAVKAETNDPYAPRARHHNEGHGRRLTAAFEALEAFPILVESRNRVMQLFEAGEPSTADVVAAVEADVALAVTVLRLANQVDGRMRGRVESAVAGVEVLSARTPEERLQTERRELGVDHALVGGVLARRWGLPKSIAAVIERHHVETGESEAALVRLADMLAHYVLGGSINPSELLSVARGIGIKPAQLRTGMYDLPLPTSGNRPRQIDPCPMSTREVDVLRRRSEERRV